MGSGTPFLLNMTTGKGTVQSMSGSTAVVVPAEHPDIVTRPLVVPFYWRETMGNLQPGDEVYYLEDDEHGGYIIGRTDGAWDNTLRGSLTVTEAVQCQSSLTADGDVTAGGKSLMAHTHIGNLGTPTSAPQ